MLRSERRTLQIETAGEASGWWTGLVGHAHNDRWHLVTTAPEAWLVLTVRDPQPTELAGWSALWAGLRAQAEARVIWVPEVWAERRWEQVVYGEAILRAESRLSGFHRPWGAGASELALGAVELVSDQVQMDRWEGDAEPLLDAALRCLEPARWAIAPEIEAHRLIESLEGASWPTGRWRAALEIWYPRTEAPVRRAVSMAVDLSAWRTQHDPVQLRRTPDALWAVGASSRVGALLAALATGRLGAVG